MMSMGIHLPGSRRNKPQALAFLFFLLLAPTLFSQRIINFNLSSTSGLVRIDFTVAKGSTCNGYKIYHSVDSLNFTVIEDYAGICSSSSENLSQTFNHTSPQPKTINYYKVELAFVETSPTKSIYVDNQSQAQLTPYPNPVLLSSESIRLRTSNTENAAMEGFVCDESGHQLRSLLLNCMDYTMDLPLYNLRSGIYFIWLSDGLYIYGTKFIVSP
jgi:hypothetical protein